MITDLSLIAVGLLDAGVEPYAAPPSALQLPTIDLECR
jgi:hypothetical protein